jgi:hypothetical protein
MNDMYLGKERSRDSHWTETFRTFMFIMFAVAGIVGVHDDVNLRKKT